MDYLFQSKRLGFREWRAADAAPFAALNADSDVMQFFPSVLSAEQSRQAVLRYQNHFKQHGFGWYATDLLASGQFIGFIGFSKVHMAVDFAPCIEIGWRLSKAYWGQGLATEGAIACLHYGWTQLDFQEVYSFTAALNKPSARVMQKAGLTFLRNFLHPKVATGHPLQEHVLYRVKNQL
jgi:RimJ/RimL family protein N-acetyltransferase